MSLANANTHAAVAESPAATSTVLLVEDERAILTLAARILRRRGYTVLEAASGPEAVQLANEHGGTIDLLLTDLSMPDLGGPDVARAVARLHPEMHVVFMSGYGAEDLAAHGVTGGARFLAKPFTPDELVEIVQDVLAGRVLR